MSEVEICLLPEKEIERSKSDFPPEKRYDYGQSRWDRIRPRYCIILCLLLTSVILVSVYRKDRDAVRAAFDLDEEALLGQFVVPFVPYKAKFMVDENSNIATCLVSRNMERLAGDIICHLKNETTCDRTDTAEELPPSFKKFPSETTTFSFVRDPFERFGAFYMKNCTRGASCFGCHDNMECVLKNIYERLMNYQKAKVKDPQLDDVIPLSWNCNFDKNFKSISKIEIGTAPTKKATALVRLLKIFAEHDVPESNIREIFLNSLFIETEHSPEDVRLRWDIDQEIFSNINVREYLHRIYFYDYLVFQIDRTPLDKQFQADFWTYYKS